MINQMANKVASVFVDFGLSSEENADIYAYAVEAIIALIINLLIAVVVSLIFGMLLEGVAFILIFAVLRRIAGGYHADSHKRCIAIFSGIVITVMFLLSLAEQINLDNNFALIISVIALLGILAISATWRKANRDDYTSYLGISVIGKFIIIGAWIINVLVIYRYSVLLGFSISLAVLAVSGGILAQRIKFALGRR